MLDPAVSLSTSRARPPTVRRDGSRVTIQIAIEPVELPVQALDEMLRLTRPRQVVILPREEHDLRRLPEVLERTEPLLALLDRHPIIVVRVQDEDRRRHVLHVLER